MGRRATSTTKSGKFMNPADQERKQARKRELKKNKKQRVTVRQALLKSKDPDDIIEQLEKLDQQEFEAGPDTSLKKQVLNEKRSKLKGTFFNVLSMYRNEKQLEKVKDMQLKMQQYEVARQQMEQNFEAVKFSKEADPGEIPLPDGLAIPGAAMTPALPSAIPAHLLLPDVPHKPGILKKAPPRKGPKSDHPPGPPCGLPPEFSGSEDEEGDDDGDLSDRRRRVRFGDDQSSDRRRPDREQAPNEFDAGEGPPPLMSLRPPAPNAPVFPPPGPRLARPPMPPPGLPPPRMGLRAPPPPPYGKPRNVAPPPPIRPPMPGGIGPHPTQVPPPNSAAVISAEPQVVKRSGGSATISAQPQLRNMQKEAVRFVPTNLRVHRPSPQQTKRPNRPVGGVSGIGSLASQATHQNQPKSTDDAYADFMKEMSDLL